MTAPKLDKTISIGNLISWAMIVVGLTAGWTKMQDSQSQTAKEATAAVAKAEQAVIIATTKSDEAKALALSVKDQSQAYDATLTSKIAVLTTDVAVIKSSLADISVDVKEIRRSQITFARPNPEQ